MVWPMSKSANYNPDTGVEKDTLLKVGKASVAIPSGFVSAFSSLLRLLAYLYQNMHERLRRHISARIKSLDTGSGINWATAEVSQYP
jgi:probable 2-oxoglutarate dehydrogenase E1 component DHKTD1